jgi:hypothetical protein
MPYTLTLTKSEREAMEWIGDRYYWGRKLLDILTIRGDAVMELDTADAWGYCDVTYTVPEHVAWEIRDNLESEDGFMPCAGSELSAKLRQFCDSIV